MKLNHIVKMDLSRRRFIQIVAGASVVSLGGMLPIAQAQAKSLPKRSVPLPKSKVHQVDKTAAEIYQCKSYSGICRGEGAYFIGVMK